jgi:two-component system cell cycle sensor histidine kinase/response regulator CckA
VEKMGTLPRLLQRGGVSVLPLSAWRRVGAVLLVAGIVGALAFWYFATRLPPIPHRPLRIGFEPNPPVQIRTDSGFSGLAVETIGEAAKRAGVRLQWVETGTSSDEAFHKGLVDLWPLMADLPERRKRIHMTPPWLRSYYVLLFRAGSVPPDRKSTRHCSVQNAASRSPCRRAVPRSPNRSAR